MSYLKRNNPVARRIIWVFGILFTLMNTVAFFHAYKFTHFSPPENNKTQDPKKLSFTQKVKIVFFGVNNPRPETKSYPEGDFTTFKLKSNKVIECWLIKSKEHKGTVVLFHGYSGEKSSMLDKAAVFLRLGYNAVLVDFMGSGGSEGNQTTIGVREAEEVKTVVDFMDSSGEHNIILFGTSMGAVAIMKAAADFKLPVSALILECPFGTLLETVEARFNNMHIPAFPMANLLVFWGGVQNNFNGFKHNPVQYAKNISFPTLLFYGEQDDKVSRKETNEIFQNLQGSKKLETFPLAGHEDYLLKYSKKWETVIEDFLIHIKEAKTAYLFK